MWVGPAAAGWMLLSLDPVSVFTVIGIISGLAFLPVLLLSETSSTRRVQKSPLLKNAIGALWSGGRTPAVWLGRRT